MSRYYLIAIVFALFTSCTSKLPPVLIAKNLSELTCPSLDDNCFSSFNNPPSFSKFKLIGNDIPDNLSSLEKIANKYFFNIENKNDSSISFSNESFFFEFFISDSNQEFIIRVQRNSSSLISFMNEDPRKLIEKIKFDFFQKNY